jgi:glutaredoxin-like YruB-family protein
MNAFTKKLIFLFLIFTLAACDDVDDDVDDEQSTPSGSTTSPADSNATLSGPMTGIYKYVDNKGVINYVDSLDKVPRKYRKRAHHPTGGAITIIPATPIDNVIKKHKVDPKKYSTPSKQIKHGDVFIYTTSWCPACTRAKSYLTKKGIPFVEKDVEKSRAALTEMFKKSGGARGVPVIDIRGKILRGFSPKQIDNALKA